MIRNKNRPEFRSDTMRARAAGVAWHFAEPGCPARNAYVGRFDGTFRAGVLDANCFQAPNDARAQMARWMLSYNEQRSHQAIGNLSLMVFKRRWQGRQSLLPTGKAWGVSAGLSSTCGQSKVHDGLARIAPIVEAFRARPDLIFANGFQ